MKLWKLTVGVMAAGLGLGGLARAAADDNEALKRKRDDLRAKQEVIYREIADARRKVEKSGEVAGAQEALAAARKAYDAKLAASTKVAESKKAIDELNAKSKAVADAELAASPEVRAAQQAVAAAEEAAFDADSQHRVAEFVLFEMKRKAGRDPSLNELRAKESKAQEAYYATKQAGKETEVEAAKAERAAAYKALTDAVAAKALATPEGEAQSKKVAELAAKAKEARDAVNPLYGKLNVARAEAWQANPKIAAARKTVDDASAAQRKLANEEAAAERAELDKAQRTLDEAVQAKLDADPAVGELRKILDGLREQWNEATAQLKPEAKPK